MDKLRLTKFNTPKTWFIGGITLLAILLVGLLATAQPAQKLAAPDATNTAAVEPTEPPVADVAVPDLTGMDGAAAHDALVLAGLTADFDAGSDSVWVKSNWLVDSQAPVAGVAVPTGTSVTLLVSQKQAPPADPNTETPSGLSRAYATTSCNAYGELAYPYGWNADFSWDGTSIAHGDGLLLKAGVDVTNAFGATGRFTVECYVSGSDNAPVVDDLVVY